MHQMLAETLIHLERGKTVKPFEGKRNFLPVDLVELLDVYRSPHFTKEESVLTADVEFDRIGGQVAVVASPRIGAEQAQTPLGTVRTEIAFEDGAVNVKQVPLRLRLDFWFQSMEDWQKLLDSRAAFTLGSETYPVQYHLESLGATPEKIHQSLKDFKILPANGRLAVPQTYNPARVLLPYDVSRIAQGVNLTMGSRG
jgi:hypothetical protein